MICATPCIVSFDKYFKQHQGIILLWIICQQATRESFSRPLWRLWCLAKSRCLAHVVDQNPIHFTYQIIITIFSQWLNVTTFGDPITPVYLVFQLGFCKCLWKCLFFYYIIPALFIHYCLFTQKYISRHIEQQVHIISPLSRSISDSPRATSGHECAVQPACEGLQLQSFSLAWPGPRGLIKGINGVHYLSDS